MDSTSRDDVRKLLKTFGIGADEAIISYLARSQGMKPLRIRLRMEDISEYPDQEPDERLHFEIIGEVRRT